MSYMGEDDEMLYKQQDAEDKRREFLEQRSRMGGPEAPEPCERCAGVGLLPCPAGDDGCNADPSLLDECGRCLGTGVQP